jgi:hypothetical protein
MIKAGVERSGPEWTVVARRSEEYFRDELGFVATPEELAEFHARHAALMEQVPRGARDAG